LKVTQVTVTLVVKVVDIHHIMQTVNFLTNNCSLISQQQWVQDGWFQ